MEAYRWQLPIWTNDGGPLDLIAGNGLSRMLSFFTWGTEKRYRESGLETSPSNLWFGYCLIKTEMVFEIMRWRIPVPGNAYLPGNRSSRQ